MQKSSSFTSWCQMSQFWFPGKYLLIFWGFFRSQVHEILHCFSLPRLIEMLIHIGLDSCWFIVPTCSSFGFCGGTFFSKYIHGFFILLSQLFFFYVMYFYSINKWLVYFVSVFSCICWALIWLLSFTVLVLFIGWFFLEFYAYIYTCIYTYIFSVCFKTFPEFILISINIKIL